MLDALTGSLWFAPLVACVVIVLVHAYLGLHVIAREVIFVDLSLAQMAALGSTIAQLFGLEHDAPQGMAYSLGFTTMGAGLFAVSRGRGSGRVPQEAIIGIVYVIASAATLLVADKSPRGGEAVKDILIGSLLWVGWNDIGLALAALGIMLYITYAFRGVPHAFRYGVAAVVAMLHDVLVVIGFEALFGHFLGWQVDSLFLTALLTVIGFSVHDTIVVFDRIRENSILYKRLPYETLVNNSINQTLARSINTQLTVLFTLFALALFGGITIQHFVVILIIGILSGTYSRSNAAPILVVWENREWRTWFKGRSPDSRSSRWSPARARGGTERRR